MKNNKQNTVEATDISLEDILTDAATATADTSASDAGAYIIKRTGKVYACDAQGNIIHALIVKKNDDKPFAIIQGMIGANGAKHISLAKLTENVPYLLQEKASSHISRLSAEDLTSYIQATETIYRLERLALSSAPVKAKKLEDYTQEELEAYIEKLKKEVK